MRVTLLDRQTGCRKLESRRVVRTMLRHFICFLVAASMPRAFPRRAGEVLGYGNFFGLASGFVALAAVMPRTPNSEAT